MDIPLPDIDSARHGPVDGLGVPLLLALTLLCAISALYRLRKGGMPLPPGPYQLPLIGNMHQTPMKNPWTRYREWHKVYGPIMSLRYGQKTIILLGTHKAVRDLLNKRGEIYSSRPHMICAGDCLSKGYSTALLPYGDTWKVHRSIQTAVLNPQISQKYRPIQEVESRQLLNEILDNNGFVPSFHRFALSVTFTLAYGKRLRHSGEPEIQEADELTRMLATTVQSFLGSMLEAYPFLNHLPRCLAPWKKTGDVYFERVNSFFARSMMAGEKAESWNWAKEAIKRNAAGELDSRQLSYAIGFLIEASTDTTSTVLEVFVMAMVLFPSVAARAQKELDTVVGPNRLPTFEDMPNLPYINALVKEALRWRPVTPLGFPHAPLEDDEYMGYRIPKGTAVFATHWGVDLDSDVFGDPHEFRPERWLEKASLPAAAFGFGRRMCPGQYLARNSLLIVTAQVLWSFDISHAYENGRKVEIDPWNMVHELVSGPAALKASMKVRSPQHRQIIEQEWAAAEKDERVHLARIQPES
ncbi:uncharacterized protein GIQ15_06342 [Arthroderma uncinatum]|uniref:uncharacterized protein n=1 Tax=Arthroderma uncinatum TaxID=74035 RepID=UPI00144AF2A9|nr:uncharacterized protein GIQ15_06342 [Arthroderma uncinatum]KAF3480995.1 hypothetical protein GIQ15_06342 [Arthroderma uncinatum]